MADEDLVLELNSLADECMALDLAVRADDDTPLDLDERANLRIVADAATVEVRERPYDDVSPKIYAVDETKGSIVGGLVHNYIRHINEKLIHRLPLA
jgi:hypothetical protein